MVRSRSPVGAKYDKFINRESAYEILTRRTAEREAATAKPAGTPQAEENKGKIHDMLWGTKKRQGMVETMAKQAARTVGGQLGQKLIRGLLGGFLGGSGKKSK